MRGAHVQRGGEGVQRGGRLLLRLVHERDVRSAGVHGERRRVHVERGVLQP
jgi:hypothetical protein